MRESTCFVSTPFEFIPHRKGWLKHKKICIFLNHLNLFENKDWKNLFKVNRQATLKFNWVGAL